VGSLLSYTLKLTDLFTNPLRRAGQAGAAAVNQVTQAAQRAGRAGGQMGSQFSAATAQLVANSTKASTSLTALDIKLNTLRQQRSVMLDTSDIARANREIQRVEERMEHLENIGRRSRGGGMMSGLMGLAAGVGIAAGVGDIVQTTAKMQGLTNTINYASGSAKEAAANQAFLTKIIHDQKLPLVETQEGFRYMSGAMIGSRLQGEATRKIFEGVSTAATVMHLDAQAAGGVFLALGQIQSKGKVQAQEMTLQLGQALPGSLKIAAKAMNMTTAEFTKNMEQGKILSEDFLPKFAAQLKKQFGPGLATATNSLQGSLTEMSNKIIELKVKLGTDFLPVIMWSLELASQFFDLLKGATGFVREHGMAFTVAGSAIAAYVVYTKAAAVGTALFEGAMWLLDAAMAANPVGLIVAGIAALVAGVIYAYNKVEWFRGGIWAFWESIKFVFNNISTLAKAVFEHITTIANPMNWFKAGVIEQANQKLAGQLVGLAKGWGNAVRKGYADGVAGIKTPDQKMEAQQYANVGAPGAGAGLGLDDSKKGKSGGATGGHGVTHITINVHELARIELHATGLAEGAEKIKHHVNQALLSVLNDANAMTVA
jgi:tape measure domain-containing protein